MKIVLVRPFYGNHLSVTPPLGLGYLSSYLKKHNVEVRIIDGLKEKLSNKALMKKILSEKPDAVGITCVTAFYKEVVDLCRLVKKNNIRCIIGGVHPTFLPYKTLVDSNADFVICGEGELALLKLMKNNFVNKNIQGVYSRKNLKKENLTIKKAKIIENLDDIPFPDWKQMDPRSYPKAPHGAIAKNFPIGIIMTTRGCPYNCTYCASPKFYDRRVRFRSPENVIQEIKYLIRNFGVKEIHFEDDNLALKREHIVGICNLLIENKIKISWACPNGIRADAVDEKILRLMKKSGCYFLAFGIESANPQILKNINKMETIDVIEKAIRMADCAGIETSGFFILGLPGETPRTIRESIRFAKKSRLSRAHFGILGILPGSELWNKLQGQFEPDWGKKPFKDPEWVPPGLSRKQLMDAQTRAFRQFYFRPRIFFKILKSIRPEQIKPILKRLKDHRIV